MRILAIRGENLASLAAPFEIDLDDGPLGTTSLFAITGETGAGKSTILDALCLALYGQYPRVSVSRREEVPDPSGQSLNSGDPRIILRRGAGEGFAEVDFLGRDGIGYRARWTAYRARNRANGRFQAETRSLHRIADGAAVATGKTLVNDAVVLRTDLNFEQFRRTVVLAQGEFDAFLLAGEGDRAELLEKITGTQVYTDISKRIRVGADERRAAFNLLVARRDAIGLLDAEARDAMAAERASIDDAMPALDAEQALLASALDQARLLAAAEARLSVSSALAVEAAAALHEGQADILRLAEIEAVEPARRPADAVAASEAGLAAAATVLETALADVQGTEADLATIQSGLVAAQAADEGAETAFKGSIADWSAADALDARVGELAREADAASARAIAAAADLDTARTRRKQLDATHDEVMASRDAAARRVATDAALAPLADRASEIAGLFDKRAVMDLERTAALAALAEAEAAIAAADAATAAAREQAASAREARTRGLAERAVHEEELRELDAEGAEAGHAHVRLLLERLARASDIAGRQERASAELERARVLQANAMASRDTAACRRTAAETAQAQATRARTEIAAMADLAERGVSAEAANLRSVLVPDQPCPVCGSSDHPAGQGGHGTDALTQLAATMRERRSEIDDELSRAASDISDAASAWADASARFETATREETQARSTLLAAADAYAGQLPGLSSACISAGMREGPPDTPGPGSLDQLALIAITAEATRTALATTLAKARQLSGRIRVEEKAIATADAEIAAADSIILAEAGPRQVAALAAERERTQAGLLTIRVESVVRELKPILVAGGLDGSDLARDPDGTARRIAELGAAYRDARQDHSGLVTALNDIVPGRAVAIEAEAAAAGHMEAATRSSADRATTLDEARRARAGLLGGEPTDVHRARITDDRDAARENYRMAREAVGIAAGLHATARGSAEHAHVQRQRAEAVLSEARGRFQASCGVREPDTVLGLLAVPQETVTALREARDRLMRAHEAAEVALATRRADLDVLRALPPVDVPGTEAAIAGIVETIANHQRRRGALDADLARDDEARGLATNLASEIGTAREDLTDWQMVDEAVGSPNGDRFRRFAQGVTLEHLAQLANEQLHVLNPRYNLMRSQGSDLALHILDRDMGDELRGTRSLSGGERFLVALALALALSGLEGRQAFVDTLFIDEGFGALDAQTLDVAIDALETLRGQGRRVGVITHVAAMIDRIAVQVRVDRRGNGRSVVRVTDGMPA